MNPISTLLVGKNAKIALEPFLKSSKIAAIAEISSQSEITAKMDSIKRSLSSGTYIVVALKV